MISKVYSENKHSNKEKEMLTQGKLKNILHYNPDTGVFVWLDDKRNHVKAGDIAGSLDAYGYNCIKIKSKSYKASRLAWLYMEGYFPEHEIDHMNRIKNDDRWNNLRHATHQCNTRNCSMAKNNSSGITGVYWHKNVKKWSANIMESGRLRYLGCFDTKMDAAKARWEGEKLYSYPNCNTTSSAYQYTLDSADHLAE